MPYDFGTGPKEVQDLFVEATQTMRVSSSRRTLLLVDDVDGLALERDKPFARALRKLVRESKCPVICTTAFPGVASVAKALGCARHVDLARVERRDLEIHLAKIATARLNLGEACLDSLQRVCEHIARTVGPDVRKATHALQLALLGADATPCDDDDDSDAEASPVKWAAGLPLSEWVGETEPETVLAGMRSVIGCCRLECVGLMIDSKYSIR